MTDDQFKLLLVHLRVASSQVVPIAFAWTYL
jgi:hypothetical protein